MSTDDEILDTLKKILALQQESLEISKEYRRTSEARADATREQLADAKVRMARTAGVLRFAKYFQIVMAVVVLSVIGYIIYRIESLPLHR